MEQTDSLLQDLEEVKHMTDIKSMSLDELKELMKEIGEKPFEQVRSTAGSMNILQFPGKK